MMTFKPPKAQPAPAQARQRKRTDPAGHDTVDDASPIHQLEALDTQLNSGPKARRTAQLQQTLDGTQAPLQRVDFDEDELQMKAAGATAQLCGAKEEYQRKADTTQRMDFDEDELQMKADSATTQRMDFDEDELQMKTAPRVAQREADTADAAPSSGGMPAPLRASIESLSGMDMSDVKVHTASPKPAQINALAYAQGSDIHLGPGQEKHLPHEAWHVVQQRQGRVQPTLEMSGVNINDDHGLEREADIMGQKALSAQLRQDD